MNFVWFDFTDFPEKVAELNRLKQLVNETSEFRDTPEGIARWKKAVAHWYEFSGFGHPEDKFYIFENDCFLASLSAGESDAKECAVTFLELDPYYFRSGYMKSKLLVRLKHLKLSTSEKERLRKIVVNAIVSPMPKCEFKYYARLLKTIGTPDFHRKISELPIPENDWRKIRQERCLNEIYWRKGEA